MIEKGKNNNDQLDITYSQYFSLLLTSIFTSFTFLWPFTTLIYPTNITDHIITCSLSLIISTFLLFYSYIVVTIKMRKAIIDTREPNERFITLAMHKQEYYITLLEGIHDESLYFAISFINISYFIIALSSASYFLRPYISPDYTHHNYALSAVSPAIFLALLTRIL